MGFNDSTISFQERCWKSLYSKRFKEFFDEYEYDGSNLNIHFNYEPEFYSIEMNKDYNEALVRKDSFYRQIKLSMNIKKKSDSSTVDSDSAVVINIPELTPRGFIIDGSSYDVINLFREAFGWCITTDKSNNIIMSLKTLRGGKFVITKDNNQLFISRGNGKKNERVGFGIWLKAITEMDSEELLRVIDMSNELISNTLRDQLIGNDGYELQTYDCIRKCVALLVSDKSKSSSKVTDTELTKTFNRIIDRIDIGGEGVERFKKFITFQRRAEGTVLSADVVLNDGTVKQAGSNLSMADLIDIDNDESINRIVVEYHDRIYSIEKYPVTGTGLDVNMMLNIMNIAFAVFTGLGILDDRDSLENKVIENVADYIIECVREYIEYQICRKLNSECSRGNADVSILAGRVSNFTDPDVIIKRYKRESNVQLKDCANIISEISKSYKLSFKRSSSNQRVNDAVRNIKVKQFMRVCPVDSPESKEIGLNTYLTNTAGVDDNGFITAKYIDINSGEVVDMNALDEMGLPIMVWNGKPDKNGLVPVHIDGEMTSVHISRVKYKDVSPVGLLSVSTSYVPFIANNKPKRALMATNMNRQAVHILGSERPRVTTASDNISNVGIYRARDIVKKWASLIAVNLTDDEIRNTTIKLIDVKRPEDNAGGLRVLDFISNNIALTGIYSENIPYYAAASSGHYSLFNISQDKDEFRDNDIVYTHRDILRDNIKSSNNYNFGDGVDISQDRIDECGYGLGKDMIVLFKSFRGFTYEDAVVLNRDLFENKSLTSIVLFECKSELQDNPALGIREYFGTNQLKFTVEENAYLESDGLPRIGSYIKSGQVVIAKRREEVSASIDDVDGNCGNKIENASVRLDSKTDGYVINKYIIHKKGIAVVSIASLNDIELGDKTVGRHGNKGVVAKIVPREDMPFAEDGTIPDMILNPLGVPARGNVGQLLETLVGIAGYKLNERQIIPPISDKNYDIVEQCKITLKEQFNFSEQTIYDGETGLPYEKPMLLGVMHMYKLLHIAKRPMKSVGYAGPSVQEASQQPKDGQRISELQTNCFIAHGATKVLDSLFSTQSDDFNSAHRARENIRECGSTIKDNIEISGINKSDEMVRAYLRTLGVDIETSGDGIRFKSLTDDDIFRITGYSDANVIESSDMKEAINMLHNELIFGAESKGISRKRTTRHDRRNKYARINLNCPVIMPVLFRNSNFLKRFEFFEISFEQKKHKYHDSDGDVNEEEFLSMSISIKSISREITWDLIRGTYRTLIYLPRHMCYVDTNQINKIDNLKLRKLAVSILSDIGFDMSSLTNIKNKETYHSTHKVDILADMYYNYSYKSVHDSAIFLNWIYSDKYINYLKSNSDFEYSYDDIVSNTDVGNSFKFVKDTKECLEYSMNRQIHTVGKDYFVSHMLVMPSSFRPRFSTAKGERYNDIDSTYMMIMSRAVELKKMQKNSTDYSFALQRLYQALSYCYKKADTSKSKISISDMLLSSNINKRSTVIRGFVGAKRVDHSCRSVITVNPTLKLTECGLPYKSLLNMCEDNLVYALKDKQFYKDSTSLTSEKVVRMLRYFADDNYYAVGREIFNNSYNPIEIAKQVEDVVIQELQKILRNSVAVLNREPSLHKFNSLAFIPVLTDGLSIQLNPLVCTAYNADFDGDHMMAILLISESAKAEALEKMTTVNNIINPQDGSNMLSIKQDIVLGIYMLTMLRNNSEEEISVMNRIPVSYYDDISIIEQDVDLGYISVYDYVAYRQRDKSSKSKGVKYRYYISTAGRIIFNSILPKNMGIRNGKRYDGVSGFSTNCIDDNSSLYALEFDCRINSKMLNGIVIDTFNSGLNNPNKETIELLDKIKDYGIKYADFSGISLSILDFEDKSCIVQDDIDSVKEIVDKYDLYERLKLLPTDDKKSAVINLWSRELKTIQGKVEDSMDKNGSLYAIIDSGARGAKSDFNAISGVIGQVRDVNNEMIERPILGNLLKGLSVDEYFVSTYQARRGQISTSTKTADSGENNRDISRLLANVKVVEDDCGIKPYHFKIKYGKIKESVSSIIIGKTITSCKYDMFVGKVISDDGDLTVADLERTQLISIGLDGIETPIPRYIDEIHRSLLEYRTVEIGNGNESIPINLFDEVEYDLNNELEPEYVITPKTLDWIEDNPQEYIDVRLMIGCISHDGVCSKCYGKDIETNKMIKVGKYIGLISATAISEVATQGTMDMHHATASASGMGSVAQRFRNCLNAKEIVKLHYYGPVAGTYRVDIRKDVNESSFTTVADDVTYDEALIAEGLAVSDGIIKVTDRETSDGKSIVLLISNNGQSTEYNISKGELIVEDGQEVRSSQPLMSYYDYNQIMNVDSDFGKEFYILDFASTFNNKIRAIHFELLGREQTSYKKVKYSVDDVLYSEVFPAYKDETDIQSELEERFNGYDVNVYKSYNNVILGKSDISKGRDIISDTFGRNVFDKLGTYAMNGKVDKCTSPLSNLYVGKKVRGDDNKKFGIDDVEYISDNISSSSIDQEIYEIEVIESDDTLVDDTQFGQDDYDDGESSVGSLNLSALDTVFSGDNNSDDVKSSIDGNVILPEEIEEIAIERRDLHFEPIDLSQLKI